MVKKLILILFSISVYVGIYSQSYITETVINFGFSYGGVSFEFMPGNKVIVSDQDSSARIYNMDGSFVSTFWCFKDSLALNYGENGVLGMCLDPDFNSNHYVYIYYTCKIDTTLRIVRLTESNNIGTNPVSILKYRTVIGLHVGGYMCFGRDNKLFVQVGNSNSSNSQLLTNARGKVLRLNSSGTIPSDNPFYDDGNPATGNDDRIWAYGLRNGYGMCINPFNDSLYASENGDINEDEINFIRKGKNYGFPICSGYCNPYNPLYKQPIMFIDDGIMLPSYASTGLFVYNGTQMPELNGRLLVIGNNTGDTYTGLLKAELGNMPYADTVSSWSVLIPGLTGTYMRQGPDGYIYILKYTPAALYRVRPNPNGINNQNIPVEYSLSQNYPNPFNPNTTIKYETPKQSFVILKIFDVLGNELASLVNENKQQGSYEVSWDASIFPSGVYFYELQAGDFKERKKMVLIK
jgi:glucose/arabinose dehydrogenase